MTARTMTQPYVDDAPIGYCVGCGAEYANRAIGCANCTARYWARAKRRAHTDALRRMYALGQAPEGYRPRYGRYRDEEAA